MSVLAVFGENLRILCQSHSSLSNVARQLGIGKVQFQRYLKGESFPKPNVLARICTYFGVDARIMLTPLSEDLMAQMRAAQPLQADWPGARRWQAAFAYAAPDTSYLNGPHSLKDGLYSVWRWSFSRPNTIFRVLVQVSERDGVKTLRGYDPSSLYPNRQPAVSRVFRGVAVRVDVGYSIMFFHSAPELVVSTCFIARRALSGNVKDAWMGYATLSRDEAPGFTRLSRCVFLPVASECARLVRLAHEPAFYTPEEAPQAIRTLLMAPLG